MSLGATTSAPARACETAVRASSSTRASLSTWPSAREQAAVPVARVLAQADVGHDDEVGVRVLDRARGELHDALVVPRARALLVLVGGDAEQQHAAEAERARPRRPPRPPAEIDSRSTPGIASIGVAAVEPGLDEQRQHEVAGVERVSRTRSRSGLVRRRRRRRVCGKAIALRA